MRRDPIEGVYATVGIALLGACLIRFAGTELSGRGGAKGSTAAACALGDQIGHA
jgi:hypothetical protein